MHSKGLESGRRNAILDEAKSTDTGGLSRNFEFNALTKVTWIGWFDCLAKIWNQIWFMLTGIEKSELT